VAEVALHHSDHASDAGGLLLILRKESTCFLFALLATLLKPLARLSKSLQSVTGNVVDAMQHANVVIEQLDAIAESDFACVNTRRVQMTDAARAAGAHIENDDMPDMKLIARKYVKSITNNLKARFSDDVGKVAQLQGILKAKSDATFAAVAALF